MLVVLPSVLELLPYSSADLKIELWRDCDITRVKQAVNVASQQDTVCGFVLAAVRERPDVSGLEHRQCSFPRDRAHATVVVGHKDSERALAKTRTY